MAQWYRQTLKNALASQMNFLSDTVAVTLHTATYTPNLDTHQYVSDLSNELAAGGGYTVGGQTLAGKYATYIAANNWGLTWAASTAYALGAMLQQGGYIYRATTAGTSGASAPTWGTTTGGTTTDNTVVWTDLGPGYLSAQVSTAYAVGYTIRPATGNGYLYRCAVAGTSAATAPTWGTVVGGTTVDGTVTWENVGSGITLLTANNPSWASATFTGVRYAVISDRTPATAATQPLLGLIDFGSNQAGQGGAFTIQFNIEGALFIFAP